jgi:S-adenosylmethionine:tRNA ribosyltransferase-isomerase
VRTSDFTYELPRELIAQVPVEPRDSARLMVVERHTGEVTHRRVLDLPDLLQAGDLVVVNDTRVMAARLLGFRPDTGGKVEALLIRHTAGNRWETLFKPARLAVPGRRFTFPTFAGPLEATVAERDGEVVTLEFEREIDAAKEGLVPLPPYIKRYEGDPERYQTIFSRDARSAAAPTAGLHFTPRLVAALAARDIAISPITLEVGPGTFRPVQSEDPAQHKMHAERFRIPPPTVHAIAAAKKAGARVAAVGTTVVRSLEHVARARGSVEEFEGATDLFILPGEPFLAVDVLLTNFHLPRSTLLMLVCAFTGTELTLKAYAEAVRRHYRFFSFGDAMLIL